MSANETLDATPAAYATTGFITGYVWSGLDNATWCAFLMYQLYYSFVILNEAALNHKPTLIWAFVFLAIACNIAASISGFFLLDCFTFNLTPDPNICNDKMHLKVVPETLGYPGAVDVVVLTACCALNLAADVPCLYSDINT
ncbi:hypothetical protein HDU77_008819, partial [Chytriomyces hyalinus]